MVLMIVIDDECTDHEQSGKYAEKYSGYKKRDEQGRDHRHYKKQHGRKHIYPALRPEFTGKRFGSEYEFFSA